jgi:hypothetical protein
MLNGTFNEKVNFNKKNILLARARGGDIIVRCDQLKNILKAKNICD